MLIFSFALLGYFESFIFVVFDSIFVLVYGENIGNVLIIIIIIFFWLSFWYFGDQIMSNDEYKSVEHRVVANSSGEPRVSVAVFLNPGKREDLYGPLPELLSPTKQPLYREFTLTEFLGRFFTKELDGKSLKNYFRLWLHETMKVDMYTY